MISEQSIQCQPASIQTRLLDIQLDKRSLESF
jgi:hypothetical protein